MRKSTILEGVKGYIQTNSIIPNKNENRDVVTSVPRDSTRIWEEMADCIRRSVREVLGVSREESRRMKGAWWWSEEVKGKVKAKQEKFKALMESRTDEELQFNKVQYKTVKKEAKKC